MKAWKKWILLFVSVVFSTLSMKAGLVNAQQPTPLPEGQTCEYQQKPKPYAIVKTQQGDLRVRTTPNGAIIGAIPKNWAVVPVQTDRTGQWVKVTSHFGDVVGGRSSIAFAGAPSFRTGWVSAKFLKRLPGKYCDKPQVTAQLQRSQLVADQEVLMHEDWMDLGDRIVRLG